MSSATRPLGEFLQTDRPRLAKGPIAILLIEDDTVVQQTLAHHLRAGFRLILALSPEPLPAHALPEDRDGRIVNLIHPCREPTAHVEAVNAVIRAAPPGTWIYYGYNAEFLFYPFSESRSVGEMLAFHAEERRSAMLTYVIDLYAPDLRRFPDAVSLEEAMFDRGGYYTLGRRGRDGIYKERQFDFYGGLRWRFEEHVPPARRKIDRIATFRAKPGLVLRPDFTFSDEEYNTYACPWHHNITTAVASFRTAKALKTNAGSKFDIPTFRLYNSVAFQWGSQQLMDLGLMEPGQWF
jgi:hypothetical protein